MAGHPRSLTGYNKKTWKERKEALELVLAGEVPEKRTNRMSEVLQRMNPNPKSNTAKLDAYVIGVMMQGADRDTAAKLAEEMWLHTHGTPIDSSRKSESVNWYPKVFAGKPLNCIPPQMTYANTQSLPNSAKKRKKRYSPNRSVFPPSDPATGRNRELFVLKILEGYNPEDVSTKPVGYDIHVKGIPTEVKGPGHPRLTNREYKTGRECSRKQSLYVIAQVDLKKQLVDFEPFDNYDWKKVLTPTYVGTLKKGLDKKPFSMIESLQSQGGDSNESANFGRVSESNQGNGRDAERILGVAGAIEPTSTNNGSILPENQRDFNFGPQNGVRVDDNAGQEVSDVDRDLVSVGV